MSWKWANAKKKGEILPSEEKTNTAPTLPKMADLLPPPAKMKEPHIPAAPKAPKDVQEDAIKPVKPKKYGKLMAKLGVMNA